MDTTFSLVIISEVLFLLSLILSFAHEELFVAFEDKIILLIMKKLELRKSASEKNRRKRLNKQVVYTPVKSSSNKKGFWDSAA